MTLTYKIKHFTLEELACPCCGLMNIHPVSIKKLDLFRDALGTPIYINSACRCEKHNKEVGGVDNSSHKCTINKHSFAFDLKATTASQKFSIVQTALRFGFHRIGVYKDFIHIDDDLTKPSAIWHG